jgi:hypothetical protein
VRSSREFATQVDPYLDSVMNGCLLGYKIQLSFLRVTSPEVLFSFAMLMLVSKPGPELGGRGGAPLRDRGIREIPPTYQRLFAVMGVLCPGQAHLRRIERRCRNLSHCRHQAGCRSDGGLTRLRDEGLVSVVLVLDDIHRPDLRRLAGACPFFPAFKTHYIRRPSSGPLLLGRHHRRALRRANLAAHGAGWNRLYAELSSPRELTGVHLFAPEHVNALATARKIRCWFNATNLSQLALSDCRRGSGYSRFRPLACMPPAGWLVAPDVREYSVVMMTCSVATTTWNSIDLVRTFLVHYQRLGFDHVLVMDFNSMDGTRDVLAAVEWRGFVTLVPFPGIASLDSSNTMLSLARQMHPDHWCLFCDPDELLVTPSMSIRHPALDDVRTKAEAISIPRFNVTAPLSVALRDDRRVPFIEALTLRVDGRHARSIEQDMKKDALDPPWIFTAIPGKVFVHVNTALSIGEGDHSALTSHDISAAAPEGTYLLHYPCRQYSAFRAKMDLARLGFAANQHLSQSHGWQVRRWIHLSDSDKLYGEYLQQFIPDEDLERLLADSTLFRDESVLTFHRTSS